MATASSGEIIYEYVRREALLGNLKSKPTSESIIAKQFGVNRSVARRAFLKLRAEGILDSRKRFGTYVKEHSIQELLEYFNLRLGLEIVAVRQAAKVATADQLEVLRMLVSNCEEMCKRMDLSILEDMDDQQRKIVELELIDSDRRLHLAFVTFSGNKMLADAYEQFNIHPIASREISQTDYHGEATRIIGEHNQLVVAIERRDPDEAERIIRNHLGFAIDALGAQHRESELNNIGRSSGKFLKV
jgi:DNA-binding GntR family transcriptional regulator